MYERYTKIAPILPFVADDRMRYRLICSVSEKSGVSKQTIRSYLCLYLSYMDVTALAPRRREDDRQLTQCQRQSENCKKRRRNFVVFRRRGG